MDGNIKTELPDPEQNENKIEHIYDRDQDNIELIYESAQKDGKIYNLEERTFEFARRVNEYANKLPYSISNTEIRRQMVKSGGSVGANYIEANESLGKNDFKMKIKISKKESKESRFWLKLSEPDEAQKEDKNYLIQESSELMNIFGAILARSK